MKHSYKIIGNPSQKELQQIKKKLEVIEGVQHVNPGKEHFEFEITMHHHIDMETLNEAIQKVGNFSIQMNHTGKSESHNSEHDHHGHHSHEDHHRMMIKDFKKRFWVSLILTIPVLLFAPMIQSWLGMDILFEGQQYVLFVLSSIIFFYGGWPFLKGIKEELGKKEPGMMTLIAIAITAAYLYSSAVVFGLEGKTFFWELATLIVVMLLGHWLEMRSILGASKALESLAALMPDTAHLIEVNGTKEVKVSSLKSGDKILIKPGEKIPADGKVEDGNSQVNESMLTGESKPVNKEKGDEVIGGAINGNGSLQVIIENTGEDAYLSKVIKMVRDAQSQKSKTQRLADKAAFWLTIIALVAGFGTFFGWLIVGQEFSFALERMVTVMVICCPHALGLAIPLVVSISTSVSAQNGLLIRNRTAFENARKIDTIVFDKTGTLTEGSHTVTKVQIFDTSFSENNILQLAASVEQPSEHHIAKGLLKATKSRDITIHEVKDFSYESGVGVQGKVNGKKYLVGGFVLLEKHGINPPLEASGDETVIFLVEDKKVLGAITFADKIRESSYGAIKTLQDNNIACWLLTGDNDGVAKAVAEKLNLNDYMADVLPEEKQEKIKKLQENGAFVAMTGDGVNDAPALAKADVGIAIGSGTDVAAETADIVLVDSDPADIANLILFGKATYNKIVQNLVWATGYNAIALPLATGFIPGWTISPAIGAALMSLSTIICAVNAQLLRSHMKV
ncbi:MAG: cadmium-translocating P-type ATPase [Saprospiraceae bacterium]|nr:cadmium-translocating P-type ATPase [Saprospiraceae bacterium]